MQSEKSIACTTTRLLLKISNRHVDCCMSHRTCLYEQIFHTNLISDEDNVFIIGADYNQEHVYWIFKTSYSYISRPADYDCDVTTSLRIRSPIEIVNSWNKCWYLADEDLSTTSSVYSSHRNAILTLNNCFVLADEEKIWSE